ncbi:MAG: hypothetical protein PWQ67_667 [Clostridia bacterium]|jgi:nitrogen fixation protein|nr:hypothetical protein [Clostridia bacterium]MDN5322213.1 hypothetical protein [Clostridia bacterium]
MPEKVVAVNKDPDGNIIAVKTDGGQVYRLEQAIMQIENGNLTGVQIVNRNGRSYLRTYPDGTPENNLDNLPEF